MSETQRKKKGGQDKNKKNQRLNRGVDDRQNVDRANVHKEAASRDSYEQDLEALHSSEDSGKRS